MNDRYKVLLKENGWVKGNFDNSENLKEKLYKLSLSFGRATSPRKHTPVIQELRPVESSLSRSCSLSKIYSNKAFPLHVDTAHWSIPSRFCIMACQNPGSGNRSTTLLDLKKIILSNSEKKLLTNTLFKVINGRESFFSTILSNDREFIRYDPGCMEPLDKDGEQAIKLMQSFHNSNNLIEFDWDIGKLLIIDNWRMLHGRSIAINNDSDRTLLRVLII